MKDKLIARLLKEGKLKKQTVGLVQVEKLLREAVIDMEEASKIRDISERGTYLLAYAGMLKTGRALVLFLGYVPDDGAQHKTVTEIVGACLGEKFSKITAHFERMRRKRNDLTYEAGTLLSGSEAKEALADAKKLIREIANYIRSQDPQSRFDFDIAQ
ncbi:MAG: hypothetical protein HQL30_12135 [Candidatus Omnitrophica bacterium]|nr:hypothetical protein [Candidatus Omnitrophota bacterium]